MVNSLGVTNFERQPVLLNTAFLGRLQHRSKINFGAVQVGFFPWVEYKKVGEHSLLSIGYLYSLIHATV
jgi:hypothetical protein